MVFLTNIKDFKIFDINTTYAYDQDKENNSF